GYAGRFYCPRMASMNRPCYAAIRAHAPEAPALVFVSSRRQTRLTALDLVSHAVADDRARAWTRMDEAELEEALASARDAHLRHCLSFGIGIHHAGLVLEDRNLVERLFVELKIQVLVATSTLAWGVNTPAHLVVVKGTEFFDAPSRRYVDYPMTDVLQMMGRAGRPGFDARGVAVVMVEESKKSYYKKFLYEPFPVESSLPLVLPDQLCAEVAAGTVRSLPDALNWLGWSFYQRRLEHNPSFYGLPDARPPSVARHLSNLLAAALGALQDAGCVRFDPETQAVAPTLAGRVAARCYLSHQTLLRASQRLKPSLSLREALEALCAAAEFDQLPVRHNEDKLNAELAKAVRWPPPPQALDDPHAKASLLLQAHLSRLPLPISDYVTDAQTALESCARVLVAFVDVCADAGWLDACCTLVSLLQGLVQAAWPDASALATLAPGAFEEPRNALRPALSGLRCSVDALPEFLERAVQDPGRAKALLQAAFKKTPQDVEACLAAVRRMPAIGVEAIPEKTGGEPALTVRLQRIRGPLKKGGGAPSAYAPFFPKIKDEGWWILVGCAETCRLLALKRISFGKSLRTTLKLPPQQVHPGKALRVYLLSDSYLGLDQEYEVAVA
ncbi:Sec63 Brl domain-containing protein, partial [Helicosporidium sp. ATCC 50920]